VWRPRAKRRGPRRGEAGETREQILRAARKQFADRGFLGTSLRGVAREAGVDPTLVHYFFASKEALFAAAVEVSAPPQPGKAAARGESAGRAFLRFHLERLFRDEREPILAMLRAAIADPATAPRLRELLTREVVEPVATQLGGRDARMRSELVGALMVGIFVIREVVGLAPLADASVPELLRAAGPVVDLLYEPPRRASRLSRK
jgi:AcrR family transcriptional regulator